MENQYAALKQEKRELMETGSEELKNQILLYANMENVPEVRAKVDLYYVDLHSVGGDKLIDTCLGLHTLAITLGDKLTDYKTEDSITLDGFKQQIDDYTSLLSAPRSDKNARSAINTEMEKNVAAIRTLLNDKMDVAMNIVKNKEPEFYNAFTSARAIMDRHGKHKATKPASETKGMISGTLTDVETGDAIADAIVQLEGTEEATTTDTDGDYAFDEVNPGMQNILCIKETYKNLRLTDIEVKAGEEHEVDGVIEKG